MIMQKLDNFDDVKLLVEKDLVEFGSKNKESPYRGTWMFNQDVNVREVIGGLFFRKTQEGVIEHCTLWGDEAQVKYGKIRPLRIKDNFVEIKELDDFDAYEELNNKWISVIN